MIALIIGIAAFCIVPIMLIDYSKPAWAYNTPPEPARFTCTLHNYTEMFMEPKTVYPCFYNQSCFTVIDGVGGGLLRVHTDCIESQAIVGNRTITCNGTVEDCEAAYLKKEGIR